MSKLECRNIYKAYEKNKYVVSNFNLKSRKKEFISLIGPSGCGKTTILRMIAGLENVSAGKIYINDRDITDVKASDRNIAMVFQSYGLYPQLNAYENIGLYSKLKGVNEKTLDEKINSIAKKIEITDCLFKKPSTLSGGQNQRVAIGKAIIREPELFLMDEPLSNLDATLRIEIGKLLRKLYDEMDTTFIYVTHDQSEAMSMSSIIFVINNGEIQQVARPRELINKPKNLFVAKFIGEPPMNLVEGIYTSGKLNIDDCTSIEISPKHLKYLNVYENKRIVLGIHSKFIQVSHSGHSVIVENVEYYGDYYINKINLSNNLLSISLDYPLELNKEYYIKFDFENVIFFDSDTKENITDYNRNEM